MRLAQLARKLALRPAEIVEFLAENNIQIEEGSNTRLKDDHVVLVMQKFAPASTAEVVEELAKEKEDESVGHAPEARANDNDKGEQVSNDAPTTEQVSIENGTIEEKPEVIKAPKIELSGLKVLGKIELPELKKKEKEELPLNPDTPAVESTESQSTKRPDREVRKKSVPRRDGNRQRVEKNPIALQREREAQEKEKQRLAKLEQEKEQRTRNYLKRVSTTGPTKRVKLVKEDTMEMSAAELKEQPKSFFGKLVHWFKS